MLRSDPLARNAGGVGVGVGVAAAERGGTGALMEIAGFALRDIIIAIGALAAVYLLYMTIGLLRLRRRKAALAKTPPPMVAPTADPAVAPPVGRYQQYLDEEAGEDDDDGRDLVYARPLTSPPPPVPPSGSAPSFGAELERSQLERDVRQLRDEVASLRRELDEMKAASRVSPQYSDAMALVQRGMTAQDVADRCSISLAEAELVCALARNPQDFEEEDDYGGEPGNNPPGRG